jgi:adenylosuccinate synthase
MGADKIAQCQAVYETLPGWSRPTAGVTQWEDLPPEARHYLKRIEQICGVPIHMVSTSPDRDHTMVLHQPFEA